MARQPGIRACLLDWGLTVIEVAGWETRGSSDFDPKGHVLHHDVVPDQPGNQDRVPSIIIVGRSDLPGPLANFWLERDGNVHLCAAGRANHAGEGGWKGLNENAEVWGTEMNNRGTPDDHWPEVQLEAMARLAAATADFSGFGADFVCGHKEWAPDRKIDPHTIDMDAFRTQVRLQEQHQEDLSIVDDKTKDYLDTKFRLARDRDRVILENERKILKKLGAQDADLKDIDEQLDRIEKEVA